MSTPKEKGRKKFECELMCRTQFIESVNIACKGCIKHYCYPVNAEQAEKILEIISPTYKGVKKIKK